MRISRHAMFMEMAHVVSKRATCFRRNVGAVVVHNNRPISIGYNGTPPGHEHCKGNQCEGKNLCTIALHAETNALEHVPPGTPWDAELSVYVTDSPCVNCLQVILRHNVVGVYFGNLYRVNEHLSNDYGRTRIYRVLPSGTVIDWLTQEIIEQ